MPLQNLWKTTVDKTNFIADKNFRGGVLYALFRDNAFDDYFAEYTPLPVPLLMLERVIYPPTDSNRESAMLNWIITFFLMAIIAAFLGFGGLAGTLTTTAKLIAVTFVALFVASLIYSIVTGRRFDLPTT